MKTTIIFCSFLLFKICCARKGCIPKYHYWQPYYGTIPPKSFNAGVDINGDVKYIARIVSIDNRTWSATTTFSTTKKLMYFGWGAETDNIITKYIDLLIVEQPSPGFGWIHINSKKDVYNTQENCCFVEGGYGYENEKKYIAYIARTFSKGFPYIGSLYIPDRNDRVVMHYMEEWKSKYMETNYEVLAYDCCNSSFCKLPGNKFIACCLSLFQKNNGTSS